VKDYVEREGIECDFEETRVFDVCLHKAGRDKAEADFAAITDADISTAKDMGYYSDEKAEEVRSFSSLESCSDEANASRRSPVSKGRSLV
jgi:alpha-D-ribose 1-methylphosphonate 5-triphosphate synthase subunit PhnG